MGFDRFTYLNTQAINLFQEAVEQYKTDCQISDHQWPPGYGWEQFRMKRFLCDTGESFGDHVDVTSHDGARCGGDSECGGPLRRLRWVSRVVLGQVVLACCSESRFFRD